MLIGREICRAAGAQNRSVERSFRRDDYVIAGLLGADPGRVAGVAQGKSRVRKGGEAVVIDRTEMTRRKALQVMGTVALAPGLDELNQDQQPPRAATGEHWAVVRGSANQPEFLDPFKLNGDRNIVDEDDFGIVNGLLTIGINYRSLGCVSGLYAPPLASSDFLLELRLFGEKVPTEKYEWHRFEVVQEGQLYGIFVRTKCFLVSGQRSGLIAISFQNRTSRKKIVPMQFNIVGGLEYVKYWGFARPDTSESVTISASETKLIFRENDAGAVCIGSDFEGMRWKPWASHWEGQVVLLPEESETRYVALTIGGKTESKQSCIQILANPSQTIDDSLQAYTAETQDLFERLPKLEASDTRLVNYYNRSLLPFLLNKWRVPEFVLNPYYGTGSIKGGCVGLYLWDFGLIARLLPLYDPPATREHIKQFLKADIRKHFLFNPMDGRGYGPLYPVNQAKIILLIYHYVLTTGDVEFLQETVNGRSALDWVLLNANYGDDPTVPAVLVDYGNGNHHLELRGKYRYDNILPDLNGRRYNSFRLAWELGKLSGKRWDYLVQRAEALKVLLKKRLWSPKDRWFFFMFDNGTKELRWTNQMFMIISSNVLDNEQRNGLVSHLNDNEFLGAYGLHSISKQDPAYDQSDIDEGGGGDYNAFNPRIAELLYQAGYRQAADTILERSLWWGERVPYWGDSFVANQIEYRKDTPLQNDVAAGAGAQCIIFGMFGVHLSMNGTLTINPRLPSWSPAASLKGLKLRGSKIDISANARDFQVQVDGHTFRSKTGSSVSVQLRSAAPVQLNRSNCNGNRLP